MSYPHSNLDLEKIVLDQARIFTAESTLVESRPARMITVCSYCERVRIGDGPSEATWISRDAYVEKCDPCHDQVSHGICPHCYEHIVQPVLAQLRLHTTFSRVVPVSAK